MVHQNPPVNPILGCLANKFFGSTHISHAQELSVQYDILLECGQVEDTCCVNCGGTAGILPTSIRYSFHILGKLLLTRPNEYS